MTSKKEKIIIDIANSDRTFEVADKNGKQVLIGKCLHCNKFLTIDLDGNMPKNITIDHIIPQCAGGSSDLTNLCIACSSCNNKKGRQHDPLYGKDPKSTELIEKLLLKRKRNYRG